MLYGIDSCTNVFCENVMYLFVGRKHLHSEWYSFFKRWQQFLLWFLYSRFYLKDSDFKEQKFQVLYLACTFCCLCSCDRVFRSRLAITSAQWHTNKWPRALILDSFFLWILFIQDSTISLHYPYYLWNVYTICFEKYLWINERILFHCFMKINPGPQHSFFSMLSLRHK